MSRRILRAAPNRNDHRSRQGLTLVEMLVAMAITLLIMAAVVTVFANITSSVTRRRATIEMSSALRNVRETLARDLAGATCPALPWQRPESNVGYLEIIEGPQNDYYPTPWLWDSDPTDPDELAPDGLGTRPGIDLTLSSLPGSNLRDTTTPDDEQGRGRTIGSNLPLTESIPTDGRGLGDADDILMLTVRNEREPFVGRIPKRFANDLLQEPTIGQASDPASRTFNFWGEAGVAPAGQYSGGHEEIESPLAEVVWFAHENPTEAVRTNAFGEPGYRTIYRRALLILPDLDYGIVVTDGNRSERASVGVVRVLGTNVSRERVDLALAALVAFQDRYDLSVRVEWDPLLPGSDQSNPGRWVLRANTLGDLTKRENRFEHHGYLSDPEGAIVPKGPADRYFPFPVASGGRYTGANPTPPVVFQADPEAVAVNVATGFSLVTQNASGRAVTHQFANSGNRGAYAYRPLAYGVAESDSAATPRAVLNEDGAIVDVTFGLAPLGGVRRGDDIMMTDALAFDLRVFDPGAPVYSYYPEGDQSLRADQVVSPGDPAWAAAYRTDALSGVVGDNVPALNAAYPFRYDRQGAYVDLAYRAAFINPGNNANPGDVARQFLRTALPVWPNAEGSGGVFPKFFLDGLFRTTAATTTSAQDDFNSRYATFDTWPTHYESNGVNEDLDDTMGVLLSDPTSNGIPAVDEGTDGFDSQTLYPDVVTALRYGADDEAERETRPPYDAPLRGLQVALRVYERDSRQIREVKVRESFVPE